MIMRMQLVLGLLLISKPEMFPTCPAASVAGRLAGFAGFVHVMELEAWPETAAGFSSAGSEQAPARWRKLRMLWDKAGGLPRVAVAQPATFLPSRDAAQASVLIDR